MNTHGFAEYIWLDGTTPTQQIRSKARVVRVPESATGATLKTSDPIRVRRGLQFCGPC